MRAVSLSLQERPEIVNFGVAVHALELRSGSQKTQRERYRVPGLWSLHLYHYHAGLAIDGEPMHVEPGVVTLTPPGSTMVFDFNRQSEHVYALFRLSSSDTDDPMVRVPLASRPATFARLDAELREGIGWWATTPRRAEVRLWDVLWQLTTNARDEDDVVDRLRSAIEQRLVSPIRVKQLIDELELGYSHNHLIRLFRKRTGQTIAGYIRQRRSDVAIGLLRGTSLPIKAVASAVGVPDPQAFNKLIRQTTGRSPSETRVLRG
ncbi:MAG: helix-turn-helix transcriptional regulator [Planctomycetota bacterium]